MAHRISVTERVAALDRHLREAGHVVIGLTTTLPGLIAASALTDSGVGVRTSTRLWLQIVEEDGILCARMADGDLVATEVGAASPRAADSGAPNRNFRIPEARMVRLRMVARDRYNGNVSAAVNAAIDLLTSKES